MLTALKIVSSKEASQINAKNNYNLESLSTFDKSFVGNCTYLELGTIITTLGFCNRNKHVHTVFQFRSVVYADRQVLVTISSQRYNFLYFVTY
jgi:hypothetical protein